MAKKKSAATGNKAIQVNLTDEMYDAWQVFCADRTFVQRHLLGALVKWVLEMPPARRWLFIGWLVEQRDEDLAAFLVEEVEASRAGGKTKKRFRADPPADNDREQTG